MVKERQIKSITASITKSDNIIYTDSYKDYDTPAETAKC